MSLIRKYWWVLLIAFLLILWVIGTIRDGNEQPVNSDSITENIDPISKVDEKDSIENTVLKVAKKQFRGVESIIYDNGQLYIVALGKDTYSGSLAKKSILMSVAKLLEEIHKLEFDYISIIITLPFKDTYGNTSEGDVLKVNYNRETIDKINWDGFESDNLITIADDYWIHDAIK